MAKYCVRIRYGNPGEHKHNFQMVYVEADSPSAAERLAIAKFRNSNSTYRHKEVDVVEAKLA